MSLEKITKNNHALHPPFYPVFDYWYNVLVDYINTYESAITLELGSDPSSIGRTYSPIISSNSINANIDAVDAAIGADPVPYVRTVGAISAAQSVNDNINDLDSIIGPDVVPAARTIGPISMATHIMANLSSIDTGIGTDAQMPDSSINVDHDITIYQNLRSLDTYKSVRTVKFKVGNVGVASCDFNFTASVGTHEEQSIDLGAIIPAKARLLDVMVITDAAFTNLGALATDIGFTTGAGDLIAVGDNTALDHVMATPNAGAFISLPITTAQHVWVNTDPTNNWDSANPVGRMSVYVTFIDVTNI